MQNPELVLAEQFIRYTRKSIFLTGKAGSGKTTLLRKLSTSLTKNMVVLAPTGLAAIQAGGVTIHAMFGLPLTGFVPNNDRVDLNILTNRLALQTHLKLRKDKIKVLREMELLVIDEISMVRADVLDAVDFVLRSVRRSREPMGGTQVLFIGDMYQLPPVVKEHEWATLRNYYQSPYFFDSLVWQELNAVHIELNYVYRQSDARFISLLNNIRHQEMDESDFKLLKSRYDPHFQPKEPGYILLTTHNKKADLINEKELGKLAGRQYVFEANINGEFPESMYPCEKFLILKEGAQVMFIRNDMGGAYYNGKLARVKTIDGDNITVTFHDNAQDYTLHREQWENISYSVEEKTEKINKKELGSFSQYPLRLAWAVTIHKSQGLTFDKVIVDAGASFAAGQVYVALSRCRSLEGIVLHSVITPQTIYGDPLIKEFSELHHRPNELKYKLKEAKVEYATYLLKRLFSFHKLSDKMDEWREALFEKTFDSKNRDLELYEEIFAALNNLNGTAQKFQAQLERLLNEYQRDNGQLTELLLRCEKAIDYFTAQIFMQYIEPLHNRIEQLAYQTKMKNYVSLLQNMKELGWLKINQLYGAHFIDTPLYTAEPTYVSAKLETTETSNTVTKKVRGETYKDTLRLYQQGYTIDEIANLRSLTVGTIKRHFERWVQTGEADIFKLLSQKFVTRVEEVMMANPKANFASLKKELGEDMDYHDVRLVMAYKQHKVKAETSDRPLPPVFV